MNTEQRSKQLEISVSQLHYYSLWLQVGLLKIITLGLYAPWGNQRLKEFLLTHTHCDNKKFNLLPTVNKTLKTRLLFGLWLVILFVFMQSFPALSWLFQLMFLISLPGFYLSDKRNILSSVTYDSVPIRFNLSIINFYKSIALPVAIFLLLSAIIFNSEMVDSQFLASIETKEVPSVYAEDSYLERAEQALQHSDHAGHSSQHELQHGNENEHWDDGLSAEEKAYLDEHEKSHNHGSISLSSLQKYQVANRGNQFLQYLCLLLLIAIMWPWIDFKMIENRVESTGYLKRSWQLKDGIMSLYALYSKVMLVVLSVITMSGLLISTLLMSGEGGSAEFWSNALVHSFWLLPLMFVITVFGFNLLMLWRKHWLLKNLASKQVAMTSNSSYFNSLVLSLTNTLFMISTLGLAIPWCQLRTYCYVTTHLTFADH